MTDEKNTSQDDQRAAPTPHAHRGNWDMLSIGSFAVAGALSLVTIFNNVRQKFHQTFVLGYGGKIQTEFNDIIAKYDGGIKRSGDHVKGLFKEHNEAYHYTVDRFKSGLVTKEELHKASKTLRESTRKAAKDMRLEIATELLEHHNIPTYGFRGWTEGFYKRWNELGKHARFDTGLGFAAVTAMGVGAIAILRHSKHTLDGIDDKLDALGENKGR